jgi:ATP-binding cassette subfamily B protein
MWWRILNYVKPYQKTVISISLLIVVMAAFNQVEPFIAKRITDSLVENRADPETLSRLLLLLGILLSVKLLHSVLNRVTWFLTNVFVVKFEAHLKKTGFDHLMNLSISYFSDQSTGKLMSKLDRGVNRIVNIVNNSGMQFLPSVTTALISFAIVLYYEWRIGVVTLMAFVPYIYINHWRFQRNNKLERQEYKLYDEQYSHFWEVLSSMSLIKAFRAEKFERTKLAEFFEKYIHLRRQMESNTNKALSGDIILESLSWGMYAFIIWLTYQGDITLGTMMLLIGLISLIRQPLWQLNWIFWEVKRAQIGAKDFFRIMDVQPDITDPEHPVELKTVEGRIRFEDVTFVYHNNAERHIQKEDDENAKTLTEKVEVFDDVTFEIKPHKMTAFVGASGSGKTTIASLVMRFFDPDVGRITLDGVDLKQLRQQDLRSHMGLVSQDAHLFATTIEENLRYAKPDASAEQMRAACEAAYATEFIDRLPAGLKTEIGERGVKLSGGQRQRLSIARTILGDPQIVILDEATSALDSESEMYIQRALHRLLKGRTSIVIAHRLSTISRADHIIVLKDKKVLEQGDHDKLLAQNGLYASLFKIQSGDKEKLKEWDLIG